MAPYSCARAAMERSETIFATASGVRRWLLVEVRGSWGHDAPIDSDLGDFVDRAWLAANKERGIRTLTVRRNLQRGATKSTGSGPDEDSPRVDLIYVDPSQPGGRAGRAWHLCVDNLADVPEATANLPGVSHSDQPDGWIPWNDPLTLVCTNGRHDSCCATFGRPLIRHLRESRWADTAWESSHVGGDRFAANIVLLPDSLYFGRCDPDSADAVLEAHANGRIHLPNYRGRSTLGFTQQAAEYFVRTEVGLDGLSDVGAVHRLERSDADDEGAYLRFHVNTPTAGGGNNTAGGGNPTADTLMNGFVVTLERSTTPSPTSLTCKGPEDVSYPVYRLIDLAEAGQPAAV